MVDTLLTLSLKSTSALHVVDEKVHNFNMALIRRKPSAVLSDNRMTSYNYRACVHPLEGVAVYSTILLYCTIDNIGPFHLRTHIRLNSVSLYQIQLL